MKRRYKSSGWCSACLIEKGDMVRTRRITEPESEEDANRKESGLARGKRARRKASEVRVRGNSFISLGGESGDADDVYVDDGEEGSEDESIPEDIDEEEIRRKRKVKPLPKPQTYTRKRKKSPGVLERIQNLPKASNVQKITRQKGKRGRPPKVKQQWPDRVDAAVYNPIDQRPKSSNAKPVTVKTSHVQLNTVKPTTFVKRRPSSFIEKRQRASRSSIKNGPSCTNKLGESRSTSKPRDHNCFESDNIAQLILLEASQRDKKWR
ncbi:hypothetical protein N0V90_002561 [Kalmusia sp. IMI 367209]|nr:hypothetical protein N0V90_002561 [Kalmusia sp. IMI 367209]